MLKLNKLSALVLAVAVSAATQAVAMDVVPGWNLLGHSGSSNVTVADTFGNASLVGTVWKWNPTQATWAFYTPGLADGGQAYSASKGYEFLSAISPGTGFWVNANTFFSATLPGTSAAAQSVILDVVPGWNLLGYSNPANVSVADAFGNASLVNTVWKWNPARANWAFYAPGLADGGQAYAVGKGYEFLSTIAPGTGFWVSAKAPFSVTLSQSSPPQVSTTFISTTTTAFRTTTTAIPTTTAPRTTTTVIPTTTTAPRTTTTAIPTTTTAPRTTTTTTTTAQKTTTTATPTTVWRITTTTKSSCSQSAINTARQAYINCMNAGFSSADCKTGCV